MAKRPSLSEGVKRPSLAESVKASAKVPTEASEPAAPPETVAPIASEQAIAVTPSVAPSNVSPSGYRAKTREGMKRLTVVVLPEEHRRIKRLSADTDRSIEDLMREALAALLAKHNA